MPDGTNIDALQQQLHATAKQANRETAVRLALSELDHRNEDAHLSYVDVVRRLQQVLIDELTRYLTPDSDTEGTTHVNP